MPQTLYLESEEQYRLCFGLIKQLVSNIVEVNWVQNQVNVYGLAVGTGGLSMGKCEVFGHCEWGEREVRPG